LAEFQGDPAAVERLLTVARWGSMEHEAERIRQQRAEQAEHEQLRTELTETGYQVADTSPEPGQLLVTLLHDGEDLTAEAHAACPGRAVFFHSWDLRSPVHYCTDPATYGHTSRSAGPPAPDGGDDPAPAAPLLEESPDPSRRLVIEGNKAWAAAAEVRRRWLATVFARRTAPRELTQFLAGQLVTMPDPLYSGLARAHQQTLFSQVTGRSVADWVAISETAPAGRLPLVMFAPVAATFEAAMSEGEGRNTWRTDRYSPCPYAQAAAYLMLLAGLGYQLSVIEQAVASQQPYTGEIPPDQAEISEGHEPADPAGGSEAGAIPDADPGDGTDNEAVAELHTAEVGEDQAAA
jgi:ParB family transcriptional regulator, chromosome partitioning protein